MHQIFTNATIFTATNDTAVTNGAIWIEGNRIKYVGPADKLPDTPSEVIHQDLGGKFVMPGMTETHAHLSFADASPFAIGETLVEDATLTAVRNARLMVASGFTSAVSFGSTYQIDVALRAAINERRIIGPRLLAAGRDLGATASNVDSGGGLSQIADGPWALRQAVREQRKLGVDVVKIFIDGEAINSQCPPGELSFTDEEVNAIVDEAHRRKLRVACHARSAAAVKQAVRAGVDYVGHANYLDDEAIELLAERRDNIFVGPAIAWEVTYLEKCESIGISRETVIKQGYEAEIEATAKTVEKLRAANIRLVVGGDYGISIAPHGTYAKDLEYFVDLFGMSNAESLICATRWGGEAYDPHGSVGTLEVDTLADLIIVDGNPLKDITVLQDHSKLSVMHDGILYRDLANPNPYLAIPAE
ncbi:MAG: amidohydrolase family protein [Pseudomonadales bacterium]|nr:amidohydrolase family protein [Pseudomonadales bacterium]MBO6594761.1 amidohydrolase family protein [Pseudomonadales bacterium]MBO6701267.1 amidohydrolase family protein [Pseudomonadales bacterium]MBO6821679.1 amidohydrolase family protein [Pseudomonadales bacterium]MBO7006541.1 amidohydrolase family protein [Pseudomonadales bacterium]